MKPRCLILPVTLLTGFLAVTSQADPQYPWGAPPMPLAGSTSGANLRNAANAVSTQAAVTRKGAYDWGRRAGWATYRDEHFRQDYVNMQLQFSGLRQNFNNMGSIALQLGRPRADNAVAELDAGLNIIAELFAFLEGQYNAGTLDRQTIVRTCKAFEDAMREWERELKKNSSRMGLVW